MEWGREVFLMTLGTCLLESWNMCLYQELERQPSFALKASCDFWEEGDCQTGQATLWLLPNSPQREDCYKRLDARSHLGNENVVLQKGHLGT